MLLVTQIYENTVKYVFSLKGCFLFSLNSSYVRDEAAESAVRGLT